MAKLDGLDRKLLACLQKDNQLTADALAASMVVPLMNEFGRTTSGELACTPST